MGVKCERSFKLGSVIPVTVMDDDGFFSFLLIPFFLSFFIFFSSFFFLFFFSLFVWSKYRWVRKRMLMIDFFPRMFLSSVEIL